MEVLVLVVSGEKKAVSSTRGMQSTVETSSLMKHRIREVVPRRMREMEEAIAARDFQEFGRLTMMVRGEGRGGAGHEGEKLAMWGEGLAMRDLDMTFDSLKLAFECIW